jgi:hypothetical protein
VKIIFERFFPWHGEDNRCTLLSFCHNTGIRGGAFGQEFEDEMKRGVINFLTEMDVTKAKKLPPKIITAS